MTTGHSIDGVAVASQSDLDALAARVALMEAAPASAGQVGPQGPQGPKGDPGPQGPEGPAAAASVDVFLAALKAMLLGNVATPPSGGTVTPLPPPPSPLPADVNVYPFTMPKISAPNEAVELGTGPDEYVVGLCVNQQPSEFDVLALLEDGSIKKIANNFEIVGPYNGKGQEFTFHGVFGKKPKFKVIGSGTRGLADLYVTYSRYNNETYYVFGDYDSRSDVYVIDAVSTYNSEGKQEVLFGPWQEPDPSTLPPPMATLSLIGGKTLEQLVADAANNVTLPNEVIYGTCLVNPGLWLVGGGRDGQTVIDLANGVMDVREKFDKAGVVLGKDSKVTDLTIQDAAINASLGQNAAGLRNVGDDGWSAERVTLKGNQNGILTNAATAGLIELTDILLDGNGARNAKGEIYGNTHQMYLGGTPELTVKGTRIKTITPCRDVHEIKFRGGNGIWTDNDLIAGDQGACYDFPNGGNNLIVGGSSSKIGGAANINLMTFGMENDNNKAIAPLVHYKNHVFKTGGLIQNGTRFPDAKIIFENCTFLGAKPELRGYKPENISGDIVKA